MPENTAIPNLVPPSIHCHQVVSPFSFFYSHFHLILPTMLYLWPLQEMTPTGEGGA